MKATFIFLSLGFAMTACVYNEELANVTDLYSTEQETILSYSISTPIKGTETSNSRSIPEDAFAQVKICIQNQMSDLHLIVEGIRICNIQLSGTYHFGTEHQVAYWETDTARTNLTIETGLLELAPNEEAVFPQEGSIPFIPQSTKAWHPTNLPQDSNACYLLLNCKVFNEVIIWGDEKGNCAEAAIPLSVHFESNQESVITLTMSSNCPWYSIQGSSPQPLFVPITFDVSVKDWKQ